MRPYRRVAQVALLVFALTFPLLFPNPAITSIAVFALLYAGAATGWNIFSGYTGYISLGHATYYGIGAYTLALMCQNWHVPGGYIPFFLVPLVGAIVGVFALPLGWIALRMRRFTFIVITIAILFIFQVLANNLHGLTNGAGGMYLPLPPWNGDSYNTPFYYVALVLAVLAFFVSRWVRSSKFGLGLLAIRDDEERTRGFGIQNGSYKLGAYVISAVFVGMVGAVSAYLIGFITPPFAFSPVFDVSITLMVFFGGISTLAGPILGALLIESLQLYLTSQLDVKGLSLVLTGMLLLVVLLYLPEGILPSFRRLWDTRKVRQENKRMVSVPTKTQEQEVSR